MEITIHRGAHGIGGTLIELRSKNNRVMIDAGYPLFLNNQPIDDDVAGYPNEKLMELGVLPNIKGLYAWDAPSFDAIIISHAHIDHYGLLRFMHIDIPVYISTGARKIIEISQLFKLIAPINSVFREFSMYKPFAVGGFRVMPFLMGHFGLS